MKKFAVLLFIGFLLIFSGCSSGEEKSESGKKDSTSTQVSSDSDTNSAETTVEDKNNEEGSTEAIFKNLPKVPTNTAEFVNQNPGIFMGQNVLSDKTKPKFLEATKNLPPLDENATEEEYDQYFQYIYSLVATDFPDPDGLISKWEFTMSGSPNVQDNRYQFKENYNIEIILDSSGSMGNIVEGGKTQMELAKEAINDFLSQVPEEANVSLRVYGHKGTGSDADKQKSCTSVEQVYGFKDYNKQEFNNALNQFEPSGWTPIAGALKASKEAFKTFDAKTNTNLIYLVSDGIGTCDGDPVKVAKSFADSNISPIINVIGFNVDSEAQKQLQQVAESANGIYTSVVNGEQLRTEFERAQEVLNSWKKWKNSELVKADYKEVINKFEITDFKNDWVLNARKQKLNLSYSFDILRREEILTFDQVDELKKRINKIEKLSNEAIEEISKDLHKVNIEKMDEFRKQINDKYNTNTQS